MDLQKPSSAPVGKTENVEMAAGEGKARPGPAEVAAATPEPASERQREGDPKKISANSEAAFARLSRRELLKVAPVVLLGVFAVPSLQESLLKRGLGFSDWASKQLFRRGHLAPTFEDSDLTPIEKFPINDYDVDDPGVILENWRLTVSGAVQRPGEYKLAQIQALPRIRQNTRHVCVEGWDVIGRFGGARLSDFLNVIGADTSARFITVGCADDYYESLDMATALHPQTLLCYEMYDQPLTREHGAPLRLNVPTKVGYKQAKYLTDLKVTNILDKVGYWEDQGYSEFYGL
ncbi:MAG TPA: molybdopterin-dependent oxidoreductase [Candidatus Sulfotelmatobacter sp.]|nr:molybdopterin-dependent oxidoreductase [Candidatus Sulfotelmatobacter sp.]